MSREQRKKYRILCDQNEMDHLNPSGFADSERGANAVKRHKQGRYRGLTYSIEKKDKRGFWQRIFG